jgi:hypothetical protein
MISTGTKLDQLPFHIVVIYGTVLFALKSVGIFWRQKVQTVIFLSPADFQRN